MILSINSENPQLRLIKKAVEVLKEGGIIVYPTDTVYGMGCDLFNKQAIERIYEIKRRNKKEPLSFICADLKDISNYALVSNYAYKTMRRLLPGAYTFVLEASRQVPKILLTKRRTVGIRVPDNKICLALVGELGHPLINTSAKLEQDEILSDPFEIEKKFKKLVDLVIDGGPLASDQSSVIDMIDDVPTVLRPGKGDVSDFL
jgi:tRNA threonylcarbamoyl adenosine modification protein (Sua5/YciO/YrdC/YwlC family)